MKIFARPSRITTLFATFAFTALAFTSGCAAEANEAEPQANEVEAPEATRIDPHAEVLLRGRPDIAPNRAVAEALLAEEKSPALQAKREACELSAWHWSVLGKTCMDPDSIEALADRCRYDGGVMKDGGCTFSGGEVKAPATVDAPVNGAKPSTPAPHPPLCTQVDVTGACKLALPTAPVAVGCAKQPCE